MQYIDTTHFRRILPLGEHISELVLQLMVQENASKTWWTWGTAIQIGDGLAISAKHLLTNAYREFEGGEIAYNEQNPFGLRENHSGSGSLSNFAFEAIQFFNNGANIRRWTLTSIQTVGYASVDLILLTLAPHPECSNATNFKLSQLPRLQLFPPEIGSEVFAVGWPDHPGTNGQLSGNDLNDSYCYRSDGIVLSITSLEVDEGYRFPHFRTSIRTENGMSGGPIFAVKPSLGGAVICGVVSRGSFVNPGLNESTMSTLWPILGQRIKSPVLGFRDGDCIVLDLARAGFINAPEWPLFSVTYDEETMETVTRCIIPELQHRGTLLGRSDWTF